MRLASWVGGRRAEQEGQHSCAREKAKEKKKKNQKANFLPLTTCATAVSAPGGLHIRYCKLIVGVGFGIFSTGRAFVILFFFLLREICPETAQCSSLVFKRALLR
jgi:hypothetical protein